ncbi:MAG: hypothetical protein IPK81_09765 [Rhodospirillales bacterium]|nr:MAG: hypothetical protein IPK81_09765 [Rhodospirillales bacterium]
MDGARWYEAFVSLPVIDGRKRLFVPKSAVRWSMEFAHQRYYNEFVLTYLQAEHLSQNTSLVETLKNGRRRVTKKSLEARFPLAKHFLAEFSEDHPDVLARYKRMLGVHSGMPTRDLDEEFDEPMFARALADELRSIQSGNDSAARFHQFMIGALEFIFYPELVYPQKEVELNDGRKRVDIAYTNNSISGFFFRRARDAGTAAGTIWVECKNYTREIANPELDQMAGRFSPARGRLGFLIGRRLDNRELFINRCRDTARDGHGFIIVLEDEDIIRMLQSIQELRRIEIDRYLEGRFRELVT